MHDKYKVSFSYGSNILASVKVGSRQTDRGQQQYAPIIRSGGIRKEDILLIFKTKVHLPTENYKKESENTKSHKNSIAQRLQTNLRRSFESITVAQLKWVAGLWSQSSQSLQRPCCAIKEQKL